MTTTFPIGALVRINRYGGAITPRDFIGQTGRVVEPWGPDASYVFVSVDGRPTPIPCLSSELEFVEDPLRVTVTVPPELAEKLLARKAKRLAEGFSMDTDPRFETSAAANLLTAALPEPEPEPIHITVTLTEAQLNDLSKPEGDWDRAAAATEAVRQIRQIRTATAHIRNATSKETS